MQRGWTIQPKKKGLAQLKTRPYIKGDRNGKPNDQCMNYRLTAHCLL